MSELPETEFLPVVSQGSWIYCIDTLAGRELLHHTNVEVQFPDGTQIECRVHTESYGADVTDMTHVVVNIPMYGIMATICLNQKGLLVRRITEPDEDNY